MSGRRDLYEQLSADHRTVERLSGELELDPERAGFDSVARRRLAHELVAAASRHEAAEEMVLWPAVRRFVADGDRLADAALAQEREAKFILDTLRMAASDQSVTELAAQFAGATRAHISYEEDTVWPALRQSTTRVANLVLGLKFMAAKMVSPTRPHPHGPDRRLGLATTGLAAAALDRVRDRLVGRRP
jgi:hemerythrin superfamily protein